MEEEFFKIDFFELAMLAEACIPPASIARVSFWHKLIDVYYFQLNEEQRAKLRSWLSKHYAYKQGLEKHDEDVLLFDARFNPDNQYKVTQEYNGELFIENAFLCNNRYYINSCNFLVKGHITKIEKL